jgi:glycosyltransferase involved in cell wall biosynthesis
MAESLKILLLIPHVGGGGAEKVAALLACGLSREKYQVHLGLITQDSTGGKSLPPWVTVHPLGARRVRGGTFRLLSLVRRLQPDLILSGAAHLNFLVLLLRPFFPRNTHVLIRQNGTVSTMLEFGGLPWYTPLLYRLLYRRADRIICQSRAMAEDLVRELGVERDLVAVLANPVDLKEILAAQESPDPWAAQWLGPGPHLLAVGRLAPEKGFDLLLEALVAVRARFPRTDLIIAGAGAEEAALKAQCRSLALESAVRLPGYIPRPYVFYAGASLFVLSSRHEGMPNALLEAVAGGLPVVATPASGGVVDLLRSRPSAWLTTEASAPALALTLIEALEELNSEPRFQRALSPEQ